MRERLCILLIACVLIMGSASSVAAVTNHNLEWGFEVGDQFHYRYTGDTMDLRFIIGTFDFYVEIDLLPTIPINVTSNMEITFTMVSPHYTWYYENGTEAHQDPPWTAFPIGNWSLVKFLLNESSGQDFEWINTLTEWGFRIVDDYDTLVRTTTVKFSKADGVMSLYHVVEEPTIGPTTTVDMTRIGFQSDSTIYLYIGTGVGIVVLVLIVAVTMKRR